MTSKRQLKGLRGDAARRAIDACLQAMIEGRVSSRHIRDALRCESSHEMLAFEKFLEHRDPLIRGNASRMMVRCAPEKVVDALLREKDQVAAVMMLKAIEDEKYKEIDALTPLLRQDDSMAVEHVFQMFVNVGRADLLFALAIGDDDRTTERVKRYLNEQHWLD